MWLSKRMARRQEEGSDGGLSVGRVSLSTAETWGVVGTSEVRTPPLAGPCGLRYRPAEGDELLLAQLAGTPICLGALGSSEGLEPGELELRAGGGSIRLCRDGRIVLSGRVEINGQIVSSSGTRDVEGETDGG